MAHGSGLFRPSGRARGVRYLPGILLVPVFLSVGQNRPEIPYEATLESCFRQALDHNPAIAAAKAAVSIKEKETRVALQLPDPQVSGGYFISPVETRVGPQKAKVGFSQMIPWPGKLIAMRNEARHELDAARQRHRAVEAEVFSGVRSVWAQLYAVGRETAITSENLELLRQMESLLLARYATAMAVQASVLKLQVEIALLEDALADLEVQAAEVRATLSRLLGVTPGGDPIAFPSALDTIDVPTDSTEMLTLADSLNPGLLEVDAQVKSAHTRVRRARQAFVPDFMFMTDYIITGESSSSMVSSGENGRNPWVVGASVTLPVWVRSKKASVDKANAGVEMQRSMQQNRHNSIAENCTRLRQEYGDAERRIRLYETTLLPKARQMLDLTDVAYRNSAATVLDFLDAQRTLLRLEIALVRQRARRESVAGMIDALLGGALTREQLGTE